METNPPPSTRSQDDGGLADATSAPIPAGTASRSALVGTPSLPKAIIGGAIAAVAGALLWGGVTYATGSQIGLIAIAVGFLVGLGTRALGKGDTPAFGVVGAAFALLGCVAGNFLAIGFFMSHEGIPFSLDLALRVFGKSMTPMDFLFYGIAVYEGFKFSYRR